MNEKKIICIIICFCIFFISITGCKSTGKSKVGIDELAINGGYEIGRLEELDKQLGAITERERQELGRALTSTNELGVIISTVFGVAFRLCDTIDELRDQIKAITENK